MLKMVFMLLVFFSSLVPCAMALNIDPTRDITYEGCFAAPSAWGGGASITYNPNGNSGAGSLLFLRGGDTTQYDTLIDVAEISIPDPIPSKTYEALNSARKLIDFTDITSIKSHPANNAGGLYYHASRNRIYWGGFIYYNVSNDEYASLGWSSTDLEAPNSTDMWYLGPEGSSPNVNKSGRYITFAPEAWADSHTDGKPLLIGRMRGAGNESSQGPVLYAVDPDDEGAPPPDGYRLPFVKLMEYNTNWPGYGYDAGEVQTTPSLGKKFPNYSAGDRFNAVAWVSVGDKQALLFAGTKSSEKWCYGNTCPDPPYGSAVQGYNFYDEDDGTPAKRKMFAWYAIDDLEAVAAGSLAADDIQPYSLVTPQNVFWGQYNGIGGVAFDSVHRKLYVVETGVGTNAYGTPRHIIHVWTVGDDGVPVEDTPEAPTDLIVE